MICNREEERKNTEETKYIATDPIFTFHLLIEKKEKKKGNQIPKTIRKKATIAYKYTYRRYHIYSIQNKELFIIFN